MRKRETPEERAAREKIADLERKAERERYIASLPQRMHETKKKIFQLGGRAEIDTDSKGFILIINYDNRDTGCRIETTIGYESDPWELDNIEHQLDREIVLRQEREARIILAQQVFDRLTEEEKKAMLENFHLIRRAF